MPISAVPEAIDAIITSRCNLRCSYCSHFDSPGHVPEDLDTGAWLTIFDAMSRWGVKKITLSGGEPFLRDDITVLLDHMVRLGMRFSVLSNGTRITKRLADYLAGTGACTGVQVSVDGADTATHESCRDRGSFEPAMSGIRRLKRAGVRVGIRVTIHRYNVDGMAAICRLLLEEYGLPGFSTNEASAMGLCNSRAHRIQLTTRERTRVIRDLLVLNEKYGDRINASAGPLAEARIWRGMIHARAQNKPSETHQGYLSGCGCVFHKLAIRADGILVPCVQLSHLELGRAGEDAPDAVWLHHPGLTRLRERQQIPLAAFDYCRECDFTAYCTGNCPALAYTAFGEENHPSPSGCLHRFLADGGELPGQINTSEER